MMVITVMLFMMMLVMIHHHDDLNDHVSSAGKLQHRGANPLVQRRHTALHSPVLLMVVSTLQSLMAFSMASISSLAFPEHTHGMSARWSFLVPSMVTR